MASVECFSHSFEVYIELLTIIMNTKLIEARLLKIFISTQLSLRFTNIALTMLVTNTEPVNFHYLSMR